MSFRTDADIGKLPIPAKAQADHADALVPGLNISTTRKGTRTFSVKYYHYGRQRRYTIGRWPMIRLAEARDRAREVLRLVQHGLDPAAQKLEARRTAVEHAFPRVVEAYISRRARPDIKTWAE